ncbi:probable LRR receptor-like serine/threonine-protein kinase At3g47570 [Coffea eugenioides]|uniref:probable LRR receptor-like serine/threonine-protein kinase At3g47570 n=1 Tax=Coffea eugenioides TaxID=49369 RepID=UPI000F613F4F|nr:probable LRR receptor-like serine/threonine-protein kinase At3g47570 [Coffea eugenioides]
MQRTYFLFAGALVLLHFVTTSSASIIVANNHNNSASDLNALLAFKATIFDPQRIIPTNWSTSSSVCNWIGITCNARHHRVAAINLSYMGIVGTIPPELGNLSFLVWLNVRNNSFHGHLPPELSRLRRVKYINLEGNAFEGELPSWLGCLSALWYINFQYNRFSGSLSGRLSNFTKLETIRLGVNFFTGSLSEEFSALPKLRVLEIEYTQLAGPLPQALFNLSSLQKIGFTGNSLSGYLPARICDYLPQLQGLYLSRNYFEGEIPSGIGECSGLQFLSLSFNKFRGYIPNGVWNLTTLTAIDLGENDLTVEIPKAIDNLYNLEQLGIRRANVTGIIPQEVGNLSKLEVLLLASNRLRGPIPLKLFNSSTVQVISLADNDLSGELPSTIGAFLPNLEELYLGINEFTGTILTSISNASRLRILDLDTNHFTGAIPHSLGNLRLLEHLGISRNDFSEDSLSKELSFIISLSNCKHLTSLWIAENPLNGFLPKSIGNLSSSLESIIASNCGIISEIPSSIGNLSNVIELNFSINSLTGVIPTTIKWFLKLQRIGLSDNQILGAIPSEFCNLLNLGELRLGQNMLSGMVPSCLGNVTTLRYVYLNSNNLSSMIPTSFWSLRYILELDMSGNYLTGSLPAEIGNLKALVYLSLSNNQYLGGIPSTIGALQDLQELSLERNKLHGLIPDSMKNMLQLRHLDLSFNNLEGEIPNSLQVLSDLQYFNVSYNRLKGPIPHGGPFANFTNLSFLSNEALCGAPWLQPCASTFEHESRTKRIVMIVLLTSGSVILALVISIFLMRLKLRKKILAPTQNLLPMATFERASFHELRQITNGFSESNLLGSGSFGSVYKGIRENGMVWAIKVFDLQLEGAFKSFDRECEVLSCLRHRNLTRVITACCSLDFKALVLEYMPNGSLEKWLHVNHHVLSIMQRLDIMIDVASGLEYLHYGYSTPIVHCDLKPSNILLDQDMVGHVCDFGIAKLLGDGESVVQTKTLATFGYIAPEYGLEGLVSTSCDVYSFGITLMETFTKRKPKDEMFTEELSLRRWVQDCLPDSVIQEIDVDLLHPEDGLVQKKINCISSILQLGLSCTTDAPQERINMKEVLRALQKIKLQFIKDITP